MTTVAADVDSAVRNRWPERGAAWSEATADELAELCAGLSATPRRTYPARFAFVVQAVTPHGATLVLRSSPDPDAGHQAAVLSRLADVGLAPRLHTVRTTLTATWTVSDAVEPGVSLRDAPRDRRDRAFILPLLRGLAQRHAGVPDAPDLLPWIRSRLTVPPTDDLPPDADAAPHRERAAALDLLDAMEPLSSPRLCHGDLSPGNALIGRDRLWLIDPRGINGEPAYDVAVVALKACRDDPTQARPAAVALAEAANADPDRAALWVTIAAAARV